jgi:hypothetical protein
MDWSSARAAVAAGVVVEFQLTEDDVVPALRRQLVRTRRLQLLLGIGVLLVLTGALSADVIDGSLGAFFGLVGVFYVGLITTIVIVGPRRAWRRNPVLRGPQLIAFFPDGIYARSMVAESRQQWRVYAAMIETDRCYMLRLTNRKAYAFVPKRAFKSSTDQAAFLNLVGLHMRIGAKPAAPTKADRPG